MRIASLILTLALGVPAVSSATLVDQHDGTIRDTSTGLEWLQNANLAGGPKTWSDANAWAQNLVYAGHDDWRLWRTPANSTCRGSAMHCTDSELGDLYYNKLCGVAGVSLLATHNLAFDLFSNVVLGAYYSETAFPESYNGPGNYWVFNMTGDQGGSPGGDRYYAWAVRQAVPPPPDPVSEPATLALLGMGLWGLVASRRRGGRVRTAGIRLPRAI